jgi:hypothetical protein
MALTDTQVQQLRAKLDARHVKVRKANGSELHYVEGWHVIAEANRIFGYDGWDRRTLVSNCVSSGQSGNQYSAAYIAKVRVTIRAEDTTIVREGSGTGEGTAPTPGHAHELALKGAETDATKRALATFGNPFGLALYDREQLGVRRPKEEKVRREIAPLVIRSASGLVEASFDKPSEFAEALREAMSKAHDMELLFAVWEQNVETVRTLNRRLKHESLTKSGIAPQLVGHLKRCAIALVKPRDGDDDPDQTTARIDKSVLTIGEPKRIRNKEHLRFVASQPCLICGRAPSHAHHVRYAQPKGLSLKVSDEFTVPLCAIHHHSNHTTGNERGWWKEQNIDPLEVAATLWRQSRKSDSAPRQFQQLATRAEKCTEAAPPAVTATRLESSISATTEPDSAPEAS